VRRDQQDAGLGRESLGAGLDHEGLLGAGQPREVVEHRQLVLARLRRLIHREAHPQPDLARVMAVIALHALEALVLAEGLHRIQPPKSTPNAEAQRTQRKYDLDGDRHGIGMSWDYMS